MLSVFSSGAPDPASSGVADPNGVTTGSSKPKASRVRSLSGGDALADEDDDNNEEEIEKRRVARRAGRRGGGLSPANSSRGLDGEGKQRKQVQRTNSGAQDRLTRSGSGAKIDEALKRSGSGTRLQINRNASGNRLSKSGSSRNLGGKSGSSRKLNANWSSGDDTGGDNTGKKSLSRNGSARNLAGFGRSGSSRNLGRSGSFKNLLGRTGSSRNLGGKSGSSRDVLGVKRTSSKKRAGGLSRSGSSRSLSRPNSGLNLAALAGAGGGDMKNHMDDMEAFIKVVNNVSQDQRDKLVMDALIQKTNRATKL